MKLDEKFVVGVSYRLDGRSRWTLKSIGEDGKLNLVRQNKRSNSNEDTKLMISLDKDEAMRRLRIAHRP